MNKVQLENNPNIRTRTESESTNSLTETSSSLSSDDQSDYQEDDDEEEEIIEIKGLFCDKTFNSYRDLYKYEFENNNFNLIDVINRYKLSMIDYIKMINFIRAEKPSPNLFQISYKNSDELPWSDEKYMKTTLDDDPALQFDIEEDLDLIDIKLTEINNNNNQISQDEKSHLDEIKSYKKKLQESESKIEELVEMVNKLRHVASDLLNKSSPDVPPEPLNSSNYNSDDSFYANSYSSYTIHLEMLQDQVRTEGYMNAILDNSSAFKDKIVLDVGCGSGILSMFAAKAGAKLVIAVDMSDIINQAIEIAKENGLENKIVFIKGKMENVKLPVEKVDIIISEWMGYYLLYESMLDSVLFARDKYLNTNGIVLPNMFEMQLFGVSDEETYDKTLTYWSDVYGFKMSIMKQFVVKDAQILVLPKESVVTDLFKLKDIDCMTVKTEDVKKFEREFLLNVNKDTFLTGIGSSFDTYFNHALLEKKSSFSTSPYHKPTHWQQTLFQFDEKLWVTKGSTIKGKITCFKNPDYQRSYIVILNVFDRELKYKID